ncbi:MAG: phytoene/squalene synthase family protein [Sphingomonas sp.]|uniref:phytoene/squalene synthase family protein n=1 Tax=Sphingomonas sp. TaxID=28214 RepID=UPI0025F01128|nr:phytoene/squalene synthase family protein [Sphingomonas sp.]MBY0283316.1 phytoene/squalene synthase family protein [Sphingomonas sp.]
MTRGDVVEAARVSIARGSRSFAAASKLFDKPTRERAWLLYSWCRACDDIADGQDHGHGMTVVDDPMARLARLSVLTELALAGEPTGEPPFEALRIVVAETSLPHGFARDHIAGFALDAEGWRPKTEDDLLRYCYRVAGVVGCMMAVVMGVDPQDEATLDRACDLGLAFQLANIARDIDEDASVGRCYLPTDWLAEKDIRVAALMAPAHRPALTELVARLTTRAAAFEESARVGTPALGFRSAWAVLAAAKIYGDIGRKVAARGGHAWDSRVTTSATEKIGAILLAGRQAGSRKARYSGGPGGGWVRPRQRP